MHMSSQLAEEAIDNLTAELDILKDRYQKLYVVAERLANSDPHNDQAGWEYAVIAFQDLTKHK